MKDPLYKLIKKTIAKLAEVPVSEIMDDMHFQEVLEIDSLEAVEILHKVEKKFKVKLIDADLSEIKTLKDVYNYCRNRIKI
ncbi:MAG: acyl carrier protein [Spirochaetes bacterium]|nr:acyl carrier protein [Spirochaetota bacterium]